MSANGAWRGVRPQTVSGVAGPAALHPSLAAAGDAAPGDGGKRRGKAAAGAGRGGGGSCVFAVLGPSGAGASQWGQASCAPAAQRWSFARVRAGPLGHGRDGTECVRVLDFCIVWIPGRGRSPATWHIGCLAAQRHGHMRRCTDTVCAGLSAVVPALVVLRPQARRRCWTCCRGASRAPACRARSASAAAARCRWSWPACLGERPHRLSLSALLRSQDNFRRRRFSCGRQHERHGARVASRPPSLNPASP